MLISPMRTENKTTGLYRIPVARLTRALESVSKRLSKHRASLALAVFLAGQALTAGADGVDIADRVAAIKPSVVGVGTFSPTRSPRANLMGTGFSVLDGRHVVSCAHIFDKLPDVEKQETWAVLTGRDRQVSVRGARIVARDKAHDLILLKIDGDPLPAVTLGDSDTAREGWQLYFTGYPVGSVLGLNASTNRAGLAAIVPIYTPVASAAQLNVRALKQASDPFSIFQLDAIAYPGNSGSPVWRPETGEVLGVVNSVFVKGAKEAALSAPSGITFAVPAKYVKALIAQAGL
jgi:S1-C subfamily serine protease